MLLDNSSAQVRIVVTMAPAALEVHFEEIGKRVAGRESAPPPLSAQERAADPELTMASSERHLARLLPPDTFDQLMTSADEESGR